MVLALPPLKFVVPSSSDEQRQGVHFANLFFTLNQICVRTKALFSGTSMFFCQMAACQLTGQLRGGSGACIGVGSSLVP